MEVKTSHCVPLRFLHGNEAYVWLLVRGFISLLVLLVLVLVLVPVLVLKAPYHLHGNEAAGESRLRGHVLSECREHATGLGGPKGRLEKKKGASQGGHYS